MKPPSRPPVWWPDRDLYASDLAEVLSAASAAALWSSGWTTVRAGVVRFDPARDLTLKERDGTLYVTVRSVLAVSGNGVVVAIPPSDPALTAEVPLPPHTHQWRIDVSISTVVQTDARPAPFEEERLREWHLNVFLRTEGQREEVAGADAVDLGTYVMQRGRAGIARWPRALSFIGLTSSSAETTEWARWTAPLRWIARHGTIAQRALRERDILRSRWPFLQMAELAQELALARASEEQEALTLYLDESESGLHAALAMDFDGAPARILKWWLTHDLGGAIGLRVDTAHLRVDVTKPAGARLVWLEVEGNVEEEADAPLEVRLDRGDVRVALSLAGRRRTCLLLEVPAAEMVIHLGLSVNVEVRECFGVPSGGNA